MRGTIFALVVANVFVLAYFGVDLVVSDLIGASARPDHSIDSMGPEEAINYLRAVAATRKSNLVGAKSFLVIYLFLQLLILACVKRGMHNDARRFDPKTSSP